MYCLVARTSSVIELSLQSWNMLWHHWKLVLTLPSIRRYSGLHPKQGYRSPGSKQNVCRMCQVRTLANSCHDLLPPTTNHKQENHGHIKLILVLRYLIHFLAKSLIWDGKIHCKHLFRSPIEFVLHRATAACGCSFLWGLFLASAKLADLASGNQKWFMGPLHENSPET